MKLTEYQEKTKKTAIYPEGDSMTYLALGISGEAGEVADKIKKHRRDDLDLDEVKDELGDLMWYIAQLSRELGFDLEEVAQSNIDKIEDRAERDKISGSGDNR